jgi:hypothetical protein
MIQHGYWIGANGQPPNNCFKRGWPPMTDDPSLASTDPHHKYVPPDIKHHRVPAPGLSFGRPNLPVLIEEIKRDLLDNNIR